MAEIRAVPRTHPPVDLRADPPARPAVHPGGEQLNLRMLKIRVFVPVEHLGALFFQRRHPSRVAREDAPRNVDKGFKARAVAHGVDTHASVRIHHDDVDALAPLSLSEVSRATHG